MATSATFRQLLTSANYRDSLKATVVFTFAQNDDHPPASDRRVRGERRGPHFGFVLTIAVALVLAFATNRVIRGRGVYTAIILFPYPIAPLIAGILWAFLFNPAVGPIAQLIKLAGIAWDPNRVGSDATILVILAAAAAASNIGLARETGDPPVSAQRGRPQRRLVVLPQGGARRRGFIRIVESHRWS